ncbi:MAG: S8 family serine peptidase [Halobacteriota archaeon]
MTGEGKHNRVVPVMVMMTVLMVSLTYPFVYASPPVVPGANGFQMCDNSDRSNSSSNHSGWLVHSVTEDKSKTRVIVLFKGKPDTKLIKEYQGEIKRSYKIIPAVAAVLPGKAGVNAMRDNPNIAYIEPDYEVQTTETLPWGIDRINAEMVWNGTEGKTDVSLTGNAGAGINIAIIDTGINYSHPDLKDNYKGGYDFVNNDTDPGDDNGHGTHCAGIIAAEANGKGIVGVAPAANLYAIKVMNSTGRGYISDVIAGFEWSITHHMDIISMSIGSTHDSRALHDACDKAYNVGLLLVSSAGNNGNADGTGDTVTYPGKYDSVIAVAAVDSQNKRASFSSTGLEVELAAPGVNIYSAYLNNTYATMSGTSMACPHVTGTAALVWAAYPDYIHVNVRERLQATAEDLGKPGKDDAFGYGLVNAETAAYVSIPDDTPPGSIANLKIASLGETQIKWTWTNPPDSDFSSTMVFQNGILMTNTSNTYYDAEALMPNTSYEIGTHTVDRAGNVNATWVNQTARTETVTALITTSYFSTLYEGRSTHNYGSMTTPISDEVSYRRWTNPNPSPGRSVGGCYTRAIFKMAAAASNNFSPSVVNSTDTDRGRERFTVTQTVYPLRVFSKP